MYKWYLPTLSEVIALGDPDQGSQLGFPAGQRVKAEREWCGAIAALNALLQLLESQSALRAIGDTSVRGLVLSGPSPVLDQPDLLSSFSAWTVTSDALAISAWMPFHLLPPAEGQAVSTQLAASTLSLLPNDPLGREQFCLALTPHFSLVMVLGEDVSGKPAFLFSFVPEVVWQAWRALRSRLVLTSPAALIQLDTLVEEFAPVAPDYRTVTQFSRLLLIHLPEPLEWESKAELPAASQTRLIDAATSAEALVDSPQSPQPSWQPALSTERKARSPMSSKGERGRSLEKLTQDESSFDTELLQAIAHEVRTPLSTIRTLTRLLLKRKDLASEVIKRLEAIDQECTEQIDRFNLIFRAVELETAPVKHPPTPLAAISLAQVFQQNLPRWQQQANQHNLTLEVVLPQKLPMVVADSTMLDQVLTGLIDRITHSLPSGSHIQLQVQLAGHQLKLQFQSKPQSQVETGNPGVVNQGHSFKPTLKSIGQLLMFQPETGSLSLNLAVTKNLFQALGGKLIVRQRPEQGEVLTIFLPLDGKAVEGS